jgi:rRNA-processing protein FCF1
MGAQGRDGASRVLSDVRIEQIFTERLWRISTEQGVRQPETIRQEQVEQVARLQELIDTLERLARKFDRPASTLAVLDTHVVLHYKPLKDIDWASLVDAEIVRLVVPLRVVDELDDRKSARRPDLVRRARSRIRQLERHVVDTKTTELRPGVTVEVVGPVDLDPEAQRRPPVPADVEILDTCQALSAYAGNNPVYLLTGDLGMRIRAEARNIPLITMSEHVEQPLATAAGRDHPEVA